MASSSEEKTTLCFIGVSSCVPDVGGETACVLLNGTVLVDAGWNAALHMRQFGCDPLHVTHVFITHCHHDHYLGLAPLFFYRAMSDISRQEQERLVVVGPRTEIGMAVQRALAYLQTDRYLDVAAPVDVVPLRPGAEFETDRLHVRTIQVVHPTLAMCYRFEDKQTGATVAVTGDTAYYAPLGRFAAGVDVLIHEAAAGPGSLDPLLQRGHSGAVDAARIAQEAGPKRLYLVHCSEQGRVEALEAAREVFPETHVPREGDTIELPFCGPNCETA